MTRGEPIEAAGAIDPRIADLVGAGAVRIAMIPSQYVKDRGSGQLRGWAVDLGHSLADRLGISLAPVECGGPDEVIARLAHGACDLGFLPNSPAWADRADFSAPFLHVEFTFLLAPGSAVATIADADRPDMRIAVVRSHASTLALQRLLAYATTVAADTLDGAFALLRDGAADAFASTRPQLIEDCARLPGSRVLEGSYGANGMTIAVAKGQAGRLAWIDEFVAAAQSAGLVRRAVERAGWRGVRMLN